MASFQESNTEPGQSLLAVLPACRPAWFDAAMGRPSLAHPSQDDPQALKHLWRHRLGPSHQRRLQGLVRVRGG